MSRFIAVFLAILAANLLFSRVGDGGFWGFGDSAGVAGVAGDAKNKFASSLFGAEPVFSRAQKFELKKDERAYAVFSESASGIRDIFEFSWTLYDHTNLVVFTKLRGYPKQAVLSRRRGLELFSQEILPATRLEKQDAVTAYLEFSEYSRGTAVLTLYIRDLGGRAQVELYPPNGSYTPPAMDAPPPDTPIGEPQNASD